VQHVGETNAAVEGDECDASVKCNGHQGSHTGKRQLPGPANGTANAASGAPYDITCKVRFVMNEMIESVNLCRCFQLAAVGTYTCPAAGAVN